MSVTRKCVQCGKIFTLNDSEIDFYNSKNLDLPKRCKTCREINKGKKAEYKRQHTDGDGHWIYCTFFVIGNQRSCNSIIRCVTCFGNGFCGSHLSVRRTENPN